MRTRGCLLHRLRLWALEGYLRKSRLAAEKSPTTTTAPRYLSGGPSCRWWRAVHGRGTWGLPLRGNLPASRRRKYPATGSWPERAATRAGTRCPASRRSKARVGWLRRSCMGRFWCPPCLARTSNAAALSAYPSEVASTRVLSDASCQLAPAHGARVDRSARLPSRAQPCNARMDGYARANAKKAFEEGLRRGPSTGLHVQATVRSPSQQLRSGGGFRR